MRRKNFNLELGNFICRFGSKKVLLDLADEIVIPAFTDTSLSRGFGKTTYFFHEVRLVAIPNKSKKPILGIIGRLVKDTTLEREQIFKEGQGLIKDSSSIKSSPSSIFMLILHNHRLLYVKETKYAPSKETFGHTALNFIRNKYSLFIDNEYEKRKKTNKPVTKKALRIEYPRPSLEIIPLTSEDSIESFVRKYNLLKTIDIKFIERNDETDNEPFFEQLQNKKDSLGSAVTALRHHNKNGLEKDEAIKEIQEATKQGNQLITLVGTDSEGDDLRGNNEKFQIKKSIPELSGNLEQDAFTLYSSFKSLIKDGIIKVPKVKKAVKKKLISLIEEHC